MTREFKLLYTYYLIGNTDNFTLNEMAWLNLVGKIGAYSEPV